MIDIDGSAHSGSGTIVRHAVAYAALTGQPVRVRNARARRQHAGLRPQHLRAIQAIRDLVGGSLDGAEVGSRSFEFRPGNTEPAVPPAARPLRPLTPRRGQAPARVWGISLASHLDDQHVAARMAAAARTVL